MVSETYDIEGYGPVTVERPSNWEGRAVVRWTDRDGRVVERKLPARLLVELSRQVARRVVRNEVVEFLSFPLPKAKSLPVEQEGA